MKFAVVVERDEDGYYVASVPELPGCHTQAKTLDELTKRIKEAIEAYLEAEGFKPREGVDKEIHLVLRFLMNAFSSKPTLSIILFSKI